MPSILGAVAFTMSLNNPVKSQEARVVHCADAIAWLAENPTLSGCSVVTSLPDVSEVPEFGLDGWRTWFTDAAERVMRATPDDGVAIFFQTDIKKSGTWVDKGYLVHDAARRAGMRLHWHKIVCLRPAGTVTFGRPAYSHLLCYARTLPLELSRATPDVLPDAGETTWTRGMGAKACEVACRYVLDATPTRTVVDPFCGQGMVLAVANAMNLAAIGVERSAKRVRKARNLVVSL